MITISKASFRQTLRNISRSIIWGTLLLPILLFAEEKLAFKHLFIEDGLSQSTILTVFQSSDQFLWFGTIDGLNRYDGYSIKIFSSQDKDSTSISDDYITCMVEDKNGYIWIGTKNNGLNRYDPRHDRFVRFLPNDRGQKNGMLSGVGIQNLCLDVDGSLWVAYRDHGVDHIYPDSGRVYNYTTNRNDKNSIGSNNVTTIFLDQNQQLWFGTQNGLDRLDRKSGKFIHVSLDGAGEPEIKAIAQSKDGFLWIGTEKGRIYRFHPRTETVELIRLPGQKTDISVRNIRFNPYTDEVIIGTYGAGLYFFDPKRKTFQHYEHSFDDLNSLSNNHILSMLVDLSGNLWIGTLKGVNKTDLKPKKFALFRIERNDKNIKTNLDNPFDNFITAVYKDRHNGVWLGSYGYGLVRFEPESGRIQQFLVSARIGTIWDITPDDDTHLWLASDKGLVRFNRATGKYRLFTPSSGLFSKKAVPNIVRILKLDNKSLLLGYLSGHFIRFHPDTKQFEQLVSEKQTRQLGTILELYKDRDGLIWIGTDGRGLYYYTPGSGKLHSFTAESDTLKWIQRVSAIREDRRGNLWLATSKGVAVYDRGAKKIQRITTREGLANNFIYALEQGRNDEFWVSSNRGLSAIRIEADGNYTIRNYGKDDGLQSDEFNTHCSFKADDGEMFFGGINGLNYFYPENVKQNPFLPKVAITRFEVNDHYLPLNPAGMELELPYDHNNIRFEFAALDFTNPAKNRYSYILEGFDKEWIKTGTQRLATYTNLSPGSYVFRVKGTNNDGLWNEEGTWVKIEIASPFWLTPLAYTTYILFIGIIVFLLIKIRSRKLEKINQLLEQRVEEKTKEVRDSYIRLRESQEQLIESAKMRAIGTMASGIVHDFNNLLSIILGSVQLIIQKNKDESLRKHLDYIQTAAKDGAKIIQKIQDFSRNSKEEATSRINVNEMLKTVVEMTQFKWLSQKRMQGIHIDFELSLEKVPNIRANRSELRLAFTNIIINAIEAFNKSGKIVITTKMVEDQWVVVSIKDEGRGMDKQTVKRIFEPFYSTKGTAGNGLGLAQVYGIISRSNGSVEVHSQLNVGTEVVIRLPISAGPDSPEDDNGLAYEEMQNTKHILIVEDELTIREIYEGILRPQGYSLVMTETAEEGLKHFDESAFDLIICDLGLPGMNGWEFVEKVRTKNKSVPIIVITGWATDDHDRKIEELNVQKVLAKPVSVMDLKQNVSAFLS